MKHLQILFFSLFICNLAQAQFSIIDGTPFFNQNLQLSKKSNSLALLLRETTNKHRLVSGFSGLNFNGTTPSDMHGVTAQRATFLFQNTGKKSLYNAKPLLFPPGNADFTLISTLHPNKKLQLQKIKLTLFIDESTAAGGTQLYRYNTTECYLDSLKGDSLIVSLVSEEIDIDARNKYTNITNTYFGSSFTKVQKSIALKNIVYIQTRNPIRKIMSRGGAVLMSAAVVLIVGSPFAGYHQTPDARIAAREHVFMAGMICFGTSVPLFVAGRPKKYAISENYLSRKNKYWRIIQNH